MRKSGNKGMRANQASAKVAPRPAQGETEVPPKLYAKELLQFTEAFRVCGCDEDTALAAAGDGRIHAYVIAQDWAVDGSEERIWDFVEIAPSSARLARGCESVPVSEAKLLPSGKKIRFRERHEVTRGALYFSAKDCRRFNSELPKPPASIPKASAPKAPGLHAERNQERTIAAMALLLVEMDPGKYTYNGKPNADAIGESVYQLLVARGLADSGLSVRSVQERILKAFKVLAI